MPIYKYAHLLTIFIFMGLALYCFFEIAAIGKEPRPLTAHQMFELVGYATFATLFTLSTVLCAIYYDR